jgi:hypothetical protein
VDAATIVLQPRPVSLDPKEAPEPVHSLVTNGPGYLSTMGCLDFHCFYEGRVVSEEECCGGCVEVLIFRCDPMGFPFRRANEAWTWILASRLTGCASFWTPGACMKVCSMTKEDARGGCEQLRSDHQIPTSDFILL